MKQVRYVGLFILSALFILQGCAILNRDANQAPYLLFEQGGADCRAASETESARVSFVEGILTFSGRIATPTPCQHLIPSLNIRGNRILIRIKAISQPGACPLCLGMVKYEGGVAGLSPGTYRVFLIHEEQRTVLDLQIAIAG
jgi:hypothetical protein